MDSLKVEGWKVAFGHIVLRKGDEIAVVAEDGTYFRGQIEASGMVDSAAPSA